MEPEEDLTLRKGYYVNFKIDIGSADIVGQGEVTLLSKDVSLWDSNWSLKVKARYIGNRMAEIDLKLDPPEGDVKRARSSLRITCGLRNTTLDSEAPPSFTNGIYRLGPNFFKIGTIKIDWQVLEDEQVSNSPLATLAHDIGKLLVDLTSHDINLQCQGQVLTAHKMILAVRSPVFKAMFETDMKELQESEVHVKDSSGQLVSPEAVKLMLTWIYTGEIGNSDSSWLDLLKLANFYQLTPLKSECESILCSQIKKENVIENLVQADLMGASHLKDACIKFINRDKSIATTQEFEDQVSRKLLLEIYIASDPNYQNALQLAPILPSPPPLAIAAVAAEDDDDEDESSDEADDEAGSTPASTQASEDTLLMQLNLDRDW